MESRERFVLFQSLFYLTNLNCQDMVKPYRIVLEEGSECQISISITERED